MSTRGQLIAWGAFVGALAGSGLGIAGFGDAMKGTIPCAIIGAVLVFLYTRPVPVGTPTPLEEIKEHAIPVAGHWLAKSWNLLMRLLMLLHLMPLCVRHPWLLVVLIVALIAFLPFLAWFFVIIGIVALHHDVNAKNQFLIDLQKRADAPE